MAINDIDIKLSISLLQRSALRDSEELVLARGFRVRCLFIGRAAAKWTHCNRLRSYAAFYPV